MNSFPLLIPSDLKSPAQQALTLGTVLLEPGRLAPLLLAKSGEANTTFLYLEGTGESMFIPRGLSPLVLKKTNCPSPPKRCTLLAPICWIRRTAMGRSLSPTLKHRQRLPQLRLSNLSPFECGFKTGLLAGMLNCDSSTLSRDIKQM